MSRRSWAALLAVVLVLGLSALAWRKPVPYVTLSPGPTVNVLGKFDKVNIISVSGHKSYRDGGALRLLTVVETQPGEKVSIPGMVFAWLDPDRSVYPYEALYGNGDTSQSVRQQSTVQMTSSQDNAVAAALRALGVHYTSAVKVAQVDKDGPADGKLKTGDLLLAVDGSQVRTPDQLIAKVKPLPIGTRVRFTVSRGGKQLTESMRTTSSPTVKTDSAVRVSVAPSYDFPFQVKLNISPYIGGPSGGLMFALGIYDVLTPGSLTGDKPIAGTGEIDDQGRVGAIGGIQQKLVGAQADGARLFLAPAANCAEALGGHFDPKKMRLVKVTTLAGALRDVRAWVKNPDAPLPRCTK